jgi:hypothetical protein
VARFYANENFPRPVVEELRRLGHDLLTIQETGRGGEAVTHFTGRCSEFAELRVRRCKSEDSEQRPPSICFASYPSIRGRKERPLLGANR